MNVVIDTNVLISGLISPSGPPSRVIDLWMENSITVFISSEIIDEYLGVLLRPRFEQIGSPEERYELVSGLIEIENTKFVIPEHRINIITEDVTDNVFLECAADARAEAIISGDGHLLKLVEYKGIMILKPADFLIFINDVK